MIVLFETHKAMVNLVVKSWLNGFAVVRSDSTKKMFSGASILITGANRGLGLEMVRQLAVRYRTCSTLARMLLSGASILITGANMGLGLEMIRQLIARYGTCSILVRGLGLEMVRQLSQLIARYSIFHSCLP